jgi:hypothetical protein
MKYFKMLLLTFLAIFILSFGTIENSFVSADDDFEERYENQGKGHEEEEPYEDLGEMAGWGTVIAMGAAGVIFPIRKSAKWILTNYPESKGTFRSISKFFGRYHLLIGTVALALSIFHGVIMYLSEGSLETEGVIGLGALIVLMIAGLFGTALFKNKKVKSLRTTHTFLIAFTLLIVFVHILSS